MSDRTPVYSVSAESFETLQTRSLLKGSLELVPTRALEAARTLLIMHPDLADNPKPLYRLPTAPQYAWLRELLGHERAKLAGNVRSACRCAGWAEFVDGQWRATDAGRRAVCDYERDQEV